MENKNIALIGFMGAGKSAAGRELARRLNMQYIDTDELIKEREKMDIPEIFSTKGERYFRECETKLLEELGRCSNIVISCGGGIVLREKNIKILKEKSTVVLLTASPRTILERVKEGKGRPILNGHMDVEFIDLLLKERKAQYIKASHVIVNTDGCTIDEVCKKIQSLL